MEDHSGHPVVDPIGILDPVLSAWVLYGAGPIVMRGPCSGGIGGISSNVELDLGATNVGVHLDEGHQIVNEARNIQLFPLTIFSHKFRLERGGISGSRVKRSSNDRLCVQI